MFELSPFMTYLVMMNVVGFVLYLIDSRLHRWKAKGRMDIAVAIAALLGGSLGIILSLLIFDRKAKKENMMSRVFVSCVLVIQLILLFMLQGHLTDHITLAFWSFFGQHQWLVVYLVIINLITFGAFAVDKMAAMEHKSRIRIVTLLALAFFGGSLGGLIAMYLFRHKTQKNYFTVGIPLMMAMQVVVLFYAMNAAW